MSQLLLDDALNALPLRMREVPQLHASEGLPYGDIAAQLGRRRSGVATQLAPALLHRQRQIASADAEAGIETAAGWFARVRDEDVSAREHARLLDWLAQDERHRRAWLALAHLWQRIVSLTVAQARALPPPMEVE